MKKLIILALAAIGFAACTKTNNSMQLTQEWDKVFPKSEKVSHEKVTFVNRFGITLVADLYKPLGAEGKLPAIA